PRSTCRTSRLDNDIPDRASSILNRNLGTVRLPPGRPGINMVRAPASTSRRECTREWILRRACRAGSKGARKRNGHESLREDDRRRGGGPWCGARQLGLATAGRRAEVEAGAGQGSTEQGGGEGGSREGARRTHGGVRQGVPDTEDLALR